MAAGLGVGYNGPLLVASTLDPKAKPSAEYERKYNKAISLKKELKKEQKSLTAQQAELEQQQAILERRQKLLEKEAAELKVAERVLQAQEAVLTRESAALEAQRTRSADAEGSTGRGGIGPPPTGQGTRQAGEAHGLVARRRACS